MQVRRDGTLTFYLNGENLGNAYKNARLTQEGVFPWVRVMDAGDCVEVLKGS